MISYAVTGSELPTAGDKNPAAEIPSRLSAKLNCPTKIFVPFNATCGAGTVEKPAIPDDAESFF